MTKEKWHTGYIPEGYPTKCDTEVVREVIQDLTDELHHKLQQGKNNIIWEKLLLSLLKAGNDELMSRKATTFIAQGGSGGGGGGGYGGGRGGDGGGVTIVQASDHAFSNTNTLEKKEIGIVKWIIDNLTSIVVTVIATVIATLIVQHYFNS